MNAEWTEQHVRKVTERQTYAEDELRRKKEKRGKITPARLVIRRSDKEDDQHNCFILEFPFLSKYNWREASYSVEQFSQEFWQLIGAGTAVVFQTKTIDPFRLSIVMTKLCALSFGWVGLLHVKSKKVEDFRIIKADSHQYPNFHFLDQLGFDYELRWGDDKSARNQTPRDNGILIQAELVHELLDKKTEEDET